MWNLSKKVSRPLVFAGAVLACYDSDDRRNQVADELRYGPSAPKLDRLCAGDSAKKDRAGDIIFLLPSLLAQKPFKLAIKNEVEGLQSHQCHLLFKAPSTRRRPSGSSSSKAGLTSVISLVQDTKGSNVANTKAYQTLDKEEAKPAGPLPTTNKAEAHKETNDPISYDLWAHNRHRYQHEFQELDRLGQGGYGTVFRCQHRLDGMEYAVKRVPLPQGDHSKSMREVLAMSRMHHQNIIQYFSSWIEPVSEEERSTMSDENDDEWNFSGESFTSSSSRSTSSTSSISPSLPSSSGSGTNCPAGDQLVLYMQMELCTGGTLKDWLNEPQRTREMPQILTIILQLASALEYIHSMKYIHRDIKPSNIFLLEHGTLKLGDFGLTKHATANITTPPIQTEHSNGHTTDVGTALYASPEQLEGGVYDCKADMYSAGVVMMEMVHPTFATQMERIQVLKQLRNEYIPPSLLLSNPRECAIIQALVYHDPTKRLSATQLIQHIQELL